jgi:hypothetical protein
MKTYIFFLFIFFLTSSCFGEELREIASIDLNLTEISKKYDRTTTRFVFTNKKTANKYYCIDLSKAIEPFVKQFTPIERKRLVIIAENQNGERLSTSYFDYDRNTVQIKPVLIFDKVKTAGLLDTIVVSDECSKNHMTEYSDLDKALGSALEQVIHLQMKDLTVSEKKRLFKSGTLVFPQDQSTERWLCDTRRIRIFMVN